MHRLFLSVDMVGSTEFKARLTGQGSASWLDVFQTFFTTFPLMAAGQVGLAFLEDESTPALDVWKVMGDEVVFVAEPKSGEEVTLFLTALLRTMRLYEARHFTEMPLRLKGTAWLADFDGQNIEIEIPELSGEGGAHLDYIGPDIDLGFRISKFARQGAMVVSLEVAEVVLAASNAAQAAFYMMGREPLKGVMFGRAYPILWMRDADEAFGFLPWEIEADAMMAAALRAEPASPAELKALIDDMRHYLRKMHHVDRRPAQLG